MTGPVHANLAGLGPRCDALDEAAARQLFNATTYQVPVHLHRQPGARVVWVNPRALQDDPARPPGVAATGAYGDHLLERTAFVSDAQAADGPSGGTAIGWADRYGGSGIGQNGGSGRAAVIGAYHVKGTGPTPLIGAGTDRAHASGGAYLEECLREAVLSELVAAEFPHGAVPTLGILDTGLIQHWPDADPPCSEPRTLLVRPAFLRPAHFERAVQFADGNPLGGAHDEARVARFFAHASRCFGRAGLDTLYRTLWSHWAAQMAYAWVHRLPHCGDSTSNICFDGRLVDFGAMAAMPGWASIGTIWGELPFGDELALLSRAAPALARHWGRHVDPSFAAPAAVDALLHAARQRYRAVVNVEILRLCGLDRARAEAVAHAEQAAAGPGSLADAIARLISHYRREHATIFGGTPGLRTPWDIAAVWQATPPPHLVRLRRLLERHVPATGADILARAAFRTRGRPALYRETLKATLHGALGAGLAGAPAPAIDAFICRQIVDNRRDGADDPVDAVPLGFARNGAGGYALFEHTATGRRFAVQEWGDAPAGVQRRRPLADVTACALVFGDGGAMFEGAVAQWRAPWPAPPSTMQPQ
ncbi:hypothetical protein [Pseudoduganella chitinolytica]|uniref:Uncharacterized protein n=1 Tax=Pseudoduganella chitinolytica TaxID=34070 RepID=A0ABY8B930_9BURK|nr:hypothetical protein [Pseudoduganella chitinolytica]WEF31563.1 hypothetical protein PX653_19150 [Pseudoduganella chitinolytica]